MDHSLDEFLDDTTEHDAGASYESQESTPTTTTTATAETVDGADSTMVWTMDGTECERCSEIVQRRWRDDEQLVCTACKEW